MLNLENVVFLCVGSAQEAFLSKKHDWGKQRAEKNMKHTLQLLLPQTQENKNT